MKRRITAFLIAFCMIALTACGQAKEAKPYMGGHFMGDTKQTVDARGNAEEVMGLSVAHWIYLYTQDEILKGVVYEVSEEKSLEDVVAVFGELLGEGKKGVRGNEQEYTEYSWVDGDLTVYAIHLNTGGNVVIQVSSNIQ